MSAALHLFASLRAAPLAEGERMLTVSVLLSAVAAPAESAATGRKVTHEVLLDGLLPQGFAADAAADPGGGGGGGAGAYRGGLRVREDVGAGGAGEGFFVEGLTELAAESEEEVALPEPLLAARPCSRPRLRPVPALVPVFCRTT
jgi:hypothetical protein